jgi:hypothetical protein
LLKNPDTPGKPESNHHEYRHHWSRPTRKSRFGDCRIGPAPVAVAVRGWIRQLLEASICNRPSPRAPLGLFAWVHLEIPPLSGSHALGRQEIFWTDPSRSEPHTQDPDDHRQTGLVVWYPAEAGKGIPAPNVPDLDAIGVGLV